MTAATVTLERRRYAALIEGLRQAQEALYLSRIVHTPSGDTLILARQIRTLLAEHPSQGDIA
ncbi:MAG: hypothetical protein ABL897_12285 [Hyphomicrobium sp.]